MRRHIEEPCSRRAPGTRVRPFHKNPVTIDPLPCTHRAFGTIPGETSQGGRSRPSIGVTPGIDDTWVGGLTRPMGLKPDFPDPFCGIVPWTGVTRHPTGNRPMPGITP